MSEALSSERGADSVSTAIGHLTAPLAAGAARSVFFPAAADGTVALPAARRPTLLLALRKDLEDDALMADATLAGTALPPVRFAPWTEAGTTLALLLDNGIGEEASAARLLALAATLGGAAVAAGDLAAWLDVVLIEGTTGRVVTLLAAETARLRREMRVLAAMRTLRHAGDDALDRVGADVGVPRLDAAPAWDAARREIVSTPGREADGAYRARLAVWRPFVAPTPAAIRSLLADVAPGVTVREPGQPLAIAVKLVAVGPFVQTQRLAARLRVDRLFFVSTGATGDAVHAARPMPPARRAAETALRARLTAVFPAAPDAAVAPRLAYALDRAARVVLALGVGGATIPIVQAQQLTRGSRYELGLGAAVTLPTAAVADSLRAALLDANRPATGDAEAEALIAAARGGTDAPEAGDRTLGWLWRAAGLATAHRLAGDSLYLSHLPTAGLTIDGPDGLQIGEAGELRAVFNAPGDPGLNAALAAALASAEASVPAAFTRVAAMDAAAACAAAIDLPPAHPSVSVLAASGLPAPVVAAPTVAVLMTLPAEIWTVLRLEAGLAGRIRAGDPASVAPLRAVVDALRAGGVVSLLPLVTPAGVLLVAGAASLPVAGVNLGERRATGVRWSVEPLGGAADAGPVGFRSTIVGRGVGLVAVVALGYVRDGTPDPYEFRVEMPAGAVLDLAGYERVMNALERCFPIGVEVNTWSLRRQHVDLDGDGAADPLPATLARHYRRFRVPRLRGLEEPAALAGPATTT